VGDGGRVAAGGLRDAFAPADQGVDHLQGYRQLTGGAAALGHTKIESTLRYLGVDVEDALTLAEHTEVWSRAACG
jgi:hypothetical protein